MKKQAILLIVFIMHFCFDLQAQQAVGNLLINSSAKTKIENRPSVVHHFADFKTGKNNIVFNLETNGFPKTDDGKELAIVVFETIVKVNGRVISQVKSSPLPFFPGEMGMPIEAFDIISPIFMHQYGLGKSSKDNPKLNPLARKGTSYEVEVRAEVINGESRIAPVFLVIII